MDRSKWLIVIMLLLAFTLAGFGVAYRYLYGRKVLAFWGAEHAARLQNAEQVTLFRLSAATAADCDPQLVDPIGKAWCLTDSREIGQIGDLRHVRRLFVQDAYFDWQATEHPPAQWRYALRFHGAAGDSTLLVDGTEGEILLLEAERQATLRPQIIPSIRRFFDSQLSK